MYLGTQNYELAAAKYDISQEPMGITDSSVYYSAIKTQHYTKQASNSNAVYKVSKTFSYVYKNCHIFCFRVGFLVMKPHLAYLVMKTAKDLILIQILKGRTIIQRLQAIIMKLFVTMMNMHQQYKFILIT